jgi:uncharacterized membrane protein
MNEVTTSMMLGLVRKSELEDAAVGAFGALPWLIIAMFWVFVVVWAILWTILPFYVMFISDRLKRMERADQAEAVARASAMQKQMEELRTQTLQLRALVDVLKGAEVERK